MSTNNAGVRKQLSAHLRSEAAVTETIENSIRFRLGDRLRALDRETGPADAVNRLVDGTLLLFDKERIYRMSGSERDDRSQFSHDQRAERYTLAFVETEIGVEDEAGNKQNFTYKEPGLEGILVAKTPDVEPNMREHLVEKLAIALKAEPRADAVMYPEFALPPVKIRSLAANWNGTSRTDSEIERIIDRQLEDSARTMLAEACSMAECAADAVPFIFYGSTHCKETRYNVGVVSPGAPFEQDFNLVCERGNPFTQVELLTESRRHSGPIVHKKRFPARRAGEEARVPDDMGFRLYPSKIGFIAVMICSDAIDINQVFYIVRHNENADRARNFDRIALVIIPAYTRSDLLHSSAKDLSELAHTTVFVGNAVGKLPTKNDLRKTKFPAPEIYQCGKDEHEIGPRGIVDKRSSYGITYYTFSPALPFR